VLLLDGSKNDAPADGVPADASLSSEARVCNAETRRSLIALEATATRVLRVCLAEREPDDGLLRGLYARFA
jgi:hypothetical protein